jgi:hypothetical protein
MSNHATTQSQLRTALARSQGDGYKQLLIAARGSTRVETNDASLVSSNGVTMNATAHQVGVTTGDVLIGGTFATIAALVNQDLVAAGFGYNLDGSAAALLADLNSAEVAICAIIVNGVPVLRAVFGAEALTGAEVEPTAGECRVALEKAGITDYLSSGLGIIVARINLARSGGAVTATHSDPATDDAIKGARLAGALG